MAGRRVDNLVEMRVEKMADCWVVQSVVTTAVLSVDQRVVKMADWMVEK